MNTQKHDAPRTGRTRAWAEVGALTVLRVLLGGTMLAHGLQKLTDFRGFQEALAGWGFPAPNFLAFPSVFAEVVGGALLIGGLATVFAAALIIIQMLSAVLVVHLPAGFFAAEGGMEFPLFLAAAAFYFLIRGGGPLSLDAAIAVARTPKGEPRKFSLRTLAYPAPRV